MTAMPSKYSSGCHMATKEEDDQRILESEIWGRVMYIRIQVQLEEDGGEQQYRTALGEEELVCGLCKVMFTQVKSLSHIKFELKTTRRSPGRTRAL